ncbi:MAG: DegV family protein, partial [Peptococcaceae bacterium]|nr:DegV family protein [Peptococcaceae bacterium]
MIKIVTDSVAEIPQAIIDKYDITVIPLYVNIMDQSFLDGMDINAQTVCEYINQGYYPQTSQAPPHEFYQVFDRLTSNGDEVLAITMSSQLSGTYQAALAAKEQLPDRKITVHDSMGVSLGQGLQVIEAAKMALLGKLTEEILPYLHRIRSKMNYAIIINSLEYVFKGGRISKAQYIAGNLLNLKLVCGSDGTGKISLVDKFIGKEKSIVRWISRHLSNLNLKDKT